MMMMPASAGPTSNSDVEAGFAKLQGEDFEYYMQTYSIILGRNSKKSTVDVDLAALGGGMNISRQHARIFYDFQRRRFALEVVGKNGCHVEGVLHLPGNPPVKLDSQDLLQIGDKKFYFLLPIRSILGGPVRHVPAPPPSQHQHHPGLHVGPGMQQQAVVPAAGYGKRPRISRQLPDYADEDEDDEDLEDDDDDDEGEGGSGRGALVIGPNKKMRRDGSDMFGYSVGLTAKVGSSSGHLEKKGETRSRADREADNHQLLQLEEKDVVSSVATVLSDLCGPGEWMPMARLHSELVEQYGNIWHHSRVRRYLTSEDWPIMETKGRPWFGLLALLRKYPEHFVINTRSKGRVTSEFVSLVSLLS